MPDILSETLVLDEYPRNEVELQLQGGEHRRLHVDGRAISKPSEAMQVIKDAVVDYIDKHDEVMGATIVKVNEPDDRDIIKSF